jgi:hypothetical protein
MPDDSLSIQNLNELREYIRFKLCEREELELGAFRLTESILTRSGQPCGMFFCLHGPRRTKFSAVWENVHNTILFYDSRGERFGRTQLVSAPVLEHRSSRQPGIERVAC